MRTTSIRSLTNILPSPTWPVCAARNDRVQHGLQLVVGHDDFDLDLGQEIDRVLRAAVHLGVALLAAEAADLGDRHARDAVLGQRLLDVIELVMPDDRFHLFHGQLLLVLASPDDMRTTGRLAATAVPRGRSDEDVPFFVVLADVEALDLGLPGNPQAHDHVDHLENHERADDRQHPSRPRRPRAGPLSSEPPSSRPSSLPSPAGAGGPGGEDAGQQRPQRAGDAVHAEDVERIVVAEIDLQPRAGRSSRPRRRSPRSAGRASSVT